MMRDMYLHATAHSAPLYSVTMLTFSNCSGVKVFCTVEQQDQRDPRRGSRSQKGFEEHLVRDRHRRKSRSYLREGVQLGNLLLELLVDCEGARRQSAHPV